MDRLKDAAAGLLRYLASRRARMPGHPRLAVAALLGLAAVAAPAAVLSFALSSSPARARPAASPAVATAAPALRPIPAPRPVVRQREPLRDPFTGERVRKLGRVLAVKIDNIVYARPQTGLRSADIVYVIPVEGGLTRFLAIFSSHIPPVVGPVRSARQSDLDILRQFGRPAFAWSGATPHLVPFIERAPVVDLYALLVGGYYRDLNRFAPYNLFASTRQLLREAPHASDARDIGFRFGSRPSGGRPIRSYSVRYPAASYTFRWSARDRRWLTWIDGAPAQATEGGQLGGTTVIIQYTQIATSRFEEYGGRPPYAKSAGSGRAVILRDGRAYTVRWYRPRLGGGTSYTMPDGKRMLFAPGQVWVVLAPRSHVSYVDAAAV